MASNVAPSMAPELAPSLAEVRFVHQVPEPALMGNHPEPWPFVPDVMAFIPGMSYTCPVDPSFYSAGPPNLFFAGPDLHGPVFSSPPPPQPQPQPQPQLLVPTFRRSRWQDDADYGSFPTIEPCTTEPMKQ